MGSAVSAVTGALGSVVGGAASGLVNNIVPKMQAADQTNINNSINNLQGSASQDTTNYNGQVNLADQQLGNTNTALGNAQSAIGTAQGINQGGNVANALSLLQGQANGTAPSAAQAQLQAGTDQAIAQQSALANSGNSSQMIAGQKNAMDNAANLIQQSANQAAQLRAQQQIAGQQNYAAAAGQQASQAGVNAGLANNLAQTNAGLYGTTLNGAMQFGGLANQANQAAGSLGVQGAGLQQQANQFNTQNQVQATGGLLNGAGGALSSGLMSGIFGGGSSTPAPAQGVAQGAPGEGASALGIADLVSDENQKNNVQSDVGLANRQPRADAIADAFRSKDTSSDTDTSKTNNSSDQAPPEKTEPNANRQEASKSISDSFMSDEDSKKDIKKDSMLHKFLDKVDSVTYDYKTPDGENGKTPGTHMGIIAQNVEKAPGGKTIVKETPEGKAVDLASAVGMLMSAAADSHDRLKAIEELFKARKEKR